MWSAAASSSGGIASSGGYVAKAEAGGTQGICRFFLTGGCFRGDSCPYSHELPDERHLDTNGVGFIFNSGVQNSGAALQRRFPPVAPSSATPSVAHPPAYHGRQPSPPPQASFSATNPSAPAVSGRPAVTSPSQSAYVPYSSMGNGAIHAPSSMSLHYPATSSAFYGPSPAPAGDLRSSSNTAQSVGSVIFGSSQGSTTAPINAAPRIDLEPYEPPSPMPYALPPNLAIAFQYAKIVPSSKYAQSTGVYSYPLQQSATHAALKSA